MERWTAQGVGWDGGSLATAPQSWEDTPEGGGNPGPLVRRRPGRRQQPSVLCQIPDCGAELIAKGYYRKYRICLEHCKATVLIIEGEEQRFCRLCGRLHDLREFDGTRGSCRRKLLTLRQQRKELASRSKQQGCSCGSEVSPQSGSSAVGDGSKDWPSDLLPGLFDSLDMRPSHRAAPVEGVEAALAAAGPPVDPWHDLQLEDPACIDLLMREFDREVNREGVAQQVHPDGASESAQSCLLGEVELALPSLPPLPIEAGPAGAAQTAPARLPLASDDVIARMSMKIFSCTPGMLAPGVRAELESMLGAGTLLLEGNIRPGCLHLLLNVLTTRDQEAALCSPQGLTNCLAALKEMPVFGDRPRILVQAASLMAVAAGQQQGPARPIFFTVSPPPFRAVLPLCTLPGPGRHALQGVDMVGFPQTKLYCRQQGRNLTMQLLDRGGAQAPCSCGAAGPELAPAEGGSCCPAVQVWGLAPGYADMEVQLGKVLSTPRAILVLPEPQAVREVRTLELSADGIADVDAFLRSTGLVVQYLYHQRGPGPRTSSLIYRPELITRLEAMARQAVVAAVARGWPALVRLLLPATTAGGSTAGEALSAMDALCPSSLSDLAAASGFEEVLGSLTEWASAEGAELVVATSAKAGPQLTPASATPAGQHLAAAGLDAQRGHGARQRADFVTEFYRQQLWKDAMYESIILACVMLATSLAYFSSGARAHPAELARRLATSVVLPSLAFIVLAGRRSATFVRWRVACVLVLRVLQLEIGVIVSPQHFDVSPESARGLELPTTAGGMAIYLLRTPILGMVSVFGHTLTLSGNLLATITFVVPALRYFPDRCEMECALPSQQQSYRNVLAAAPDWIAAPPLGADAAGACMVGCTFLNSWLMVFLGGVVPVWVAALVERRAWWRYQGRAVSRGRIAALLLLNLCGLALAGGICLLLAQQWALL